MATVNWLVIASDGPMLKQRFARTWQTQPCDFTRVLQKIQDRPKKTPILNQNDGSRIAIRAYSNLVLAVGLPDPEDETLAFELIHLLIMILDDYFGCVRESDIVAHPDVIAKTLELMVSGGIIVETNRAQLVKKLKHWK